MEGDLCEAKCSTEDVLSSLASPLPISASEEIVVQTDLNTTTKCFRSVKSETDDSFYKKLANMPRRQKTPNNWLMI